MARRIYLHIGLPKTGTTFLQTTMWHNRKTLQKRGFLYPGSQPFDHYRALAELRERGAADKAPKPRWERLTRQLRKFDGDGLVSHEFFSMLKKGKAAKVVADLAPAEVHLVVTARSYVLQWPAVWQEGLKMFVDAPFDEFMAGAETHELPRCVELAVPGPPGGPRRLEGPAFPRSAPTSSRCRHPAPRATCCGSGGARPCRSTTPASTTRSTSPTRRWAPPRPRSCCA